MKVIERKDLPECYAEMMMTESHHDHKIIEDEHGTIRWEKHPHVDELVDRLNLNDLCVLLQIIGHGKNSEVYRALYRHMGYSLSSYIDVFYWDVNSDEAADYVPPCRNEVEVLESLAVRLKDLGDFDKKTHDAVIHLIETIERIQSEETK